MPITMIRYMSISVVAKRLYLVQNDDSFGGVDIFAKISFLVDSQ